MAKRVAGKQLTDLNWEEEEVQEEAGQFVAASQEVLKTREIKKAKRRGPGGTSEISSSSEAFKGFSGFGATSKPFTSFSFGTSSETKSSEEKENLNTTNISAKNNPILSKLGDNLDDKKSTESNEKEKLKNEYLSQLRSLNEGVTKWIKQHVDKNPYCILTPIFSDYAKHLETIEKNNPSKTNINVVGDFSDNGFNKSEENMSTTTSSSGGFTFTSNTSNASGFSIKSTTSNNEQEKHIFKPFEKTTSEYSFASSMKAESEKPTSSAGESKDKDDSDEIINSSISPSEKQSSLVTTSNTHSNKTEDNTLKSASSLGGFTFTSNTSNAGGFNFNSTNDSNNQEKFTFKPFEKSTSTLGATPGFSFASTIKAESEKPTSSGKDEDDYVPPIVETTQVIEEDAHYTKRCKLFYQKNGAWLERGVGNIHLKPCNGKTQLLIRADTNLGNVLLNIMLNHSIPFKRQGKNNVSMVCVPNPPIDPKSTESKPVSMLIRVKTEEDADELYSNVEKYKKD